MDSADMETAFWRNTRSLFLSRQLLEKRGEKYASRVRLPKDAALAPFAEYDAVCRASGPPLSGQPISTK